jgi:mannose-6-phosphate isomerase-like protein (cupin superfamily)
MAFMMIAKPVLKVWGTEQVIANNPFYCGKIMRLREGWQCSLHHHKIKDETFYVLSGRVWFELGDMAFEMKMDDIVRVTPYTKHRFGGITDAMMVEVSTHHSEDDVYRHEESRHV